MFDRVRLDRDKPDSTGALTCVDPRVTPTEDTACDTDRMRRLVFSIIAATGLVMVGPSTAFADTPAPVVSATATPGKKICKVTDTKLDELSGIVATKTGFIVIDDSTTLASHKRVFFLDDKCQIVKQVQYSGAGPADTEDMVLSPDGKTLWIADTGDDGVRAATPTPRNTVALWTMPADGSAEPKIHRLSYPDGDYHDAEALLLNGSTPLIITKELGKPAYIYEPTAALKTDNVVGVPMKRVGEITLSATETPGNTVARIGNKTVDGGAIALGGGKVALRTYTDALEWDVTGGNVLAALKGRPRTTGLPNEPFGESITYSPDGKYFFTVSDMNGVHTIANYIAKYTPATTVATVKASAAATGGSGAHWYSNLTIDQITYLVGGVGVLGLILVGAGVLGIVRSRKNASATAGYGGLDDVSPADPETELIGVGGAPQRAGVYGGAAARTGPASAAASGGMYGGPTGGGQRGGSGVYGGAPGGAPRYARPPQGGQQPPSRGGQQPPRGPQPPQRGGQPPRGPQAPTRNGVYGAPQSGHPQGQPGRGPAPQGQRPQGPGPNGQAPFGQGGPGPGQRPQGPQGQRPQRPAQRPQGGTYGQGGPPPPDDGYADFNGRPEGRYDNPGYGRR